jgi:hypothetical protein
MTMDDRCERLRPLIYRVAEGEAGPDEALVVGRHLPDCTVCRIRLAREVRLARLVAEMGEPIEVDENFLQKVMSSLPEGPPPKVATVDRRGKRRGLKLAGFLLAVGLAGAVAHSLIPSPGGRTIVPGLPAFDFESVARMLGSAREQVQYLLAALAGIGTGGNLDLPSAPALVHLALLACIPLSVGFLAGAALLTCAAGTLARSVNRSPGT